MKRQLTVVALLALPWLLGGCQRELIPSTEFFYQVPQGSTAGNVDAGGLDQTGTGAVCGDGKCTSPEDASSCPADCGGPQPVCGDGTCQASENPQSCPADCAASGGSCGNATCSASETAISCAADCGQSTDCGDMSCNAGETAAGCPTDCDPDLQPIISCVASNCLDTASQCMNDLTCLHVTSVALKCMKACSWEVECANTCIGLASSDNDKAGAVFVCFANNCLQG